MSEDDTYPGGIPEAEEWCPRLPPEMRQPGTAWPCRVCGSTKDDPDLLRKCLSETARLTITEAR